MGAFRREIEGVRLRQQENPGYQLPGGSGAGL